MEGEASGETGAPLDYQEAFASVKDKRCRVGRVSLVGLRRTKAHLVQRELLRVRHAGTLDEIKDALLEAYEDLMGLDVFSAVDILLDEGAQGGDTCDIIAQFQEKNTLRLHTGTYMQGQEGSVEASVNLCNALGYAEQISLAAECGSQTTNAGLSSVTFTCSLTKPRPYGYPVVADVRLHQLYHNCQRWSSFTELLRGGMFTLTNEDGRHALSYELGWRHLTDPAGTASRAVLAQLGDKMLSAVKYVFRTDTFDDPFYPSTGWGVRAESQLAGLGLDANLLRFVKQRLAAKVALPVSDQTTLTLTAEAGVLLPWGARAWGHSTSISDRFFVGGVGTCSLRGFAQKGVGPTDTRRKPQADEEAPAAASRRDSLGGDLYCSLLAALNFQLPHEGLRSVGCHGQLFLNGGSLAALGSSGKAMQQCVHELVTSFRWTTGIGLVWPTRMGRLELNVCRVLSSQQHDCVKQGIQFGFSPPVL